MFRDSACQETVTSHVRRFRICFLAGSAAHVYCSTELSRFRVDKKSTLILFNAAYLSYVAAMIIYVFLLFYVVRIQNVSLHLRFLPSTQVSQHLQHWEGLPLLLPSGIAKKSQEMPGQPSKILKTSVRSPSKYVAHFVLLKCVDIAI